MSQYFYDGDYGKKGNAFLTSCNNASYNKLLVRRRTFFLVFQQKEFFGQNLTNFITLWATTGM